MRRKLIEIFLNYMQFQEIQKIKQWLKKNLEEQKSASNLLQKEITKIIYE